MGIVITKEDIETRMLREAREKRRAAGFLDTWIEFPRAGKARVQPGKN